MLQLKLGIQLESLKLPFRRALQIASQLGARGVEINARSELKPAELTRTGIRHIRKLLADQNLAVCSVHFPTRRGFSELEDLEKRIESTKAAMSMAYELGCNVVVNRIGAIPPSDPPEAWTTLLQALAELSRHGQRVGAWFAARTGTDSGSRMAEVIAALPPGMIGIDFDPGSLVIHGHSAEDAMRSLAKHVLTLRAFDGVRDSAGRAMHVQLGRGSVDFPPLLSLLEEKHFAGYIIVERNVERDAVASCQQTVDYLQSLFQ